jgi:hypothetical protein
MNGADTGVLAVKRTLDMHQAGVVAGGTHLCTCVENVTSLLGKHGARYIRVLDGEGAAEATALLYIREFDEVDPTDCLEEPERAISQLQTAKAVAARVIGDAMRVVGSYIFKSELLGEELGELPYAGEDAVDLFDKCLTASLGDDPPRHHGIVIADHGDTGRGWDDDGFRVAKLIDKSGNEWKSLRLVAGVPVHLAAAGLPGRKVYSVTETLEHSDNGLACRWKERVVIAGDKERDLHDGASAFPECSYSSNETILSYLIFF